VGAAADAAMLAVQECVCREDGGRLIAAAVGEGVDAGEGDTCVLPSATKAEVMRLMDEGMEQGLASGTLVAANSNILDRLSTLSSCRVFVAVSSLEFANVLSPVKYIYHVGRTVLVSFAK
jgi:hypothetical protein